MIETPFESVPSFVNKPTTDPNLFRVCDRNGDWIVYYHDKEKKYKWSVNYIIRNGFPKGDRFYQYLLGTTKEESKKLLESSGERGSRIHQVIKKMILGEKAIMGMLVHNELTNQEEPLTNDEWDILETFVNFCQDYKPKLIYSERTVHKGYYAGTLDFLGTIEYKGKEITVLIDFKTGNTYPEHKLQTAAYAHALKKLPDYTAILRLGTRHKRGYELILWDIEETKRHFMAFKASYNNFQLEFPPYEHKERLIPKILEVKIPPMEQREKISSNVGQSTRLKGTESQKKRRSTQSAKVIPNQPTM